jgi:hypothetical protein
MFNGNRSNQVKQIVSALASLPGSMAVNITSRKFPRLGPAEPGSGYEESQWSFPVSQLPEALAVPSDSEEIVITVQGSLPAPGTRDELVARLDSLLGPSGVGDQWDVRTHFSQVPHSEYELQVIRQ